MFNFKLEYSKASGTFLEMITAAPFGSMCHVRVQMRQAISSDKLI